jgi:7-cyano-7-deazaguanine synthase
MGKILAICSGGLDSSIMLHSLKGLYDISALHFVYPSKHSERETMALVRLTCSLKVKYIQMNVSPIFQFMKSSLLKSGEDIPEGHYEADNMKSTVIPFRNGIFLSIAAGIAESEGFEFIAIANHSGDHHIYPDCRPDFIETMGKTINFGTDGKVDLMSPFLHKNKAEILALGLNLGTPLEQTWTCYKGKSKACGKCGACQERLEAFKICGVKDPLIYED